MPVLGALIKQGLKLSTRVRLRSRSLSNAQHRELKKLLSKAQYTAFGKLYNFSAILVENNIAEADMNYLKVVDTADEAVKYIEDFYKTHDLTPNF